LVQTVTEEDLIETSYLKLKQSPATTSSVSAPYQVAVSKLPTGLQELSVSPDGKRIVYYTWENGSTWYTSNPDGTNKTNIYKNPLSSWLVQWYSQNSMFLVTKATNLAPSFGYTMSASGGKLTRVFGNTTGASAKISSNGKWVMVASGGVEPILNVVDATNGARTATQVKTLAEKCSWDASDINYMVCGVPKSLANSNYPDEWYKGERGENDLVERVNVTNNIMYVVSDPSSDAETNIDVKEMYVSKNGFYAAFLNKTDSALWLLNLKE
jgi:hypothetical protein